VECQPGEAVIDAPFWAVVRMAGSAGRWQLKARPLPEEVPTEDGVCRPRLEGH